MWYEFRSDGKRLKTGYYLLIEANSVELAFIRLHELGAKLADYRDPVTHEKLEYTPLGLDRTRPVAELISNAPDFGTWQNYNAGIPPESHGNGMVILWADGRIYLSNGVEL